MHCCQYNLLINDWVLSSSHFRGQRSLSETQKKELGQTAVLISCADQWNILLLFSSVVTPCQGIPDQKALVDLSWTQFSGQGNKDPSPLPAPYGLHVFLSLSWNFPLVWSRKFFWPPLTTWDALSGHVGRTQAVPQCMAWRKRNKLFCLLGTNLRSWSLNLAFSVRFWEGKEKRISFIGERSFLLPLYLTHNAYWRVPFTSGRIPLGVVFVPFDFSELRPKMTLTRVKDHNGLTSKGDCSFCFFSCTTLMLCTQTTWEPHSSIWRRSGWCYCKTVFW